MRLKKYIFTTIATLAFFVGTVPVLFAQQNAPTFFVKHIVFEAEYDPHFIWTIANSAIPWDRNSTARDIACAEKTLLDTKLFANVTTRLHKLDQPNAYELVISLTYLSQNPVYKLARIEILGFSSIATSNLRKELSKIFVGQSISLKTTEYSLFEDRILDAAKRILKGDTEAGYRDPVIELKLNKSHELEIILLPELKLCTE